MSIRYVLSANARDPPRACRDAGGVETREGSRYVRGDKKGAVISEGDARRAGDCQLSQPPAPLACGAGGHAHEMATRCEAQHLG